MESAGSSLIIKFPFQESSTTKKITTTLPTLTDDELLPENEQSVEQTTQFSGTETFSKKIAVIS